MAQTLHDFTADGLDGQARDLAQFQGSVALVVNTATKCGLAPQLSQLEALWQRHRDEGFVVLGFPSDQFAGQELDDDADIAEACQINHGVTFPMFAKTDVNGARAHPVWQWLRTQKKGLLGGRIAWNYTKFLVDRDGRVVKRFAPTTSPESLDKHVVAQLDR